MAEDTGLKVPTLQLEKLLLGVLDLRLKYGDYERATMRNYAAAAKHFIKWYDRNIVNFESTRLLVFAWISRAKDLNDNRDNYRVIGNFVRAIADVLEAQLVE